MKLFRATSLHLVLLTAFVWGLGSPSAVEGAKRRAFATSVAGTGDLGSWPDAGNAVGIAAGNEIRQARASAAGLSNAWAFRAWLSDDATDAFCNLQGLTGKRATACNGQSLPFQGPWFRPSTSAADTPPGRRQSGPAPSRTGPRDRRLASTGATGRISKAG